MFLVYGEKLLTINENYSTSTLYLCKIWVISFQISLSMENIFWDDIFCILFLLFLLFLHIAHFYVLQMLLKPDSMLQKVKMKIVESVRVFNVQQYSFSYSK